ncbi:MAG: transglutaminase domain-containing protein [Gemmatimonadota bacterium]|nr:transglutaminase domain-containing protein [Gemmatimonadota bacterium]HEU4988702.1 transglutaminase-like domain-containing protein [Gemmatimonadaceae bacterium]
MSRRGWAAAVVLVLWAAGIVALIRREYFQPNVERLAEAAARVTPGAVFYAVLQGNRQIGFASSTIDTVTGGITSTDYLVADLPAGGSVHRLQARTTIEVSRALRVRRFDVDVESDSSPFHAGGRVEGDSVVVYVTSTGGAPSDSQRVRIGGPVLLPTLVPLAIALGEEPKVGKSYVLPVFDPSTMAPKDARITVSAETTFVVNDSSVMDSATKRWRGLQPDTLRAWRLTSQGERGVGGWVDNQGRVVSTTQMGFRLERRPYEVAYENWRMDEAADSGAAAVNPTNDILETTAIAANLHVTRELSRLRVVLSHADLAGFDLDGGRQSLHGDTLTVVREHRDSLANRFFMGVPRPRDVMKALEPEPLVESRNREIRALAQRLRGRERDPRVVAERINRWVYDSVRPRITFGVPDAVQVLHTRSGDCNEHTQLYLALARAAGIPARAAAGLAYVGGKFYYHAWPEVYLGRWVAVDPTFDQFPADAAHLRFVVGGLARQTSLLSLIGVLRIDVLDATPLAAGH